MSGFRSDRIDKRELSLALKRATAGDIRAFAAELDRLDVPDDRGLETDGAVLRLDVWDKPCQHQQHNDLTTYQDDERHLACASCGHQWTEPR